MTDTNWTADDFYARASRPNAAPPTTPSTAPAGATKTDADIRAEDFYAKATKVEPGSGKAVQTAPATPATTTPAETAAIVSNLKTLGVEFPDGLDPSRAVAFHDAAIKAHRATQDAEVAGWEAQTRRDVPQHEIAAATAFASEHLDAEVRAVLTSSGLGSHPSFVRLAAKLGAALSRR